MDSHKCNTSVYCSNYAAVIIMLLTIYYPNNDLLMCIVEIKQVINADDVKEDKIASVLKTLLSTAKFFFLKNETASQVTKMKFHGVKIVFAEMFCFLRYLMALSEHFTITVIEKCSCEIQSVLIVISDYCAWMICRGMYFIHVDVISWCDCCNRVFCNRIRPGKLDSLFPITARLYQNTVILTFIIELLK